MGGVWGAVVGMFGVEASPSSYVGKMWEPCCCSVSRKFNRSTLRRKGEIEGFEPCAWCYSYVLDTVVEGQFEAR